MKKILVRQAEKLLSFAVSNRWISRDEEGTKTLHLG